MKSLTLANNCHGAFCFIAVLAIIVCFSTSALAVEDGLGTNIVRNLRVQPGGSLVIDNTGGPTGSIMLNGDPIYDWNDLSMNIIWDSMQADLSLSNHVATIETTTNALNTAVTNEIVVRVAAETGISNAYNTADLGVSNAFHVADLVVSNAYIQADLGVSNAFHVADLVVSNAYIQADLGVSNALNSAKYDKGGGPITGNVTIAGNVTMSSNVVYTPGDEPGVVIGTAIGSDQAVKTISAVGDIVMTANPPIATGTATAGQMLTLIYKKTDANSIGLTNSTGLALAGGVSFTMKSNDVLQVVFDGTKWIEVHRTDNQ